MKPLFESFFKFVRNKWTQLSPLRSYTHQYPDTLFTLPEVSTEGFETQFIHAISLLGVFQHQKSFTVDFQRVFKIERGYFKTALRGGYIKFFDFVNLESSIWL